MALKPTIYKLKINLANINRNYYDLLNLTIARHPSETSERMMARVLAFCINAQQDLSFTKGLSCVEEPDIWARTLDGRISLWIDVGEPAFDRIKKATRLSPTVKIYTFNLKSDYWWTKDRAKFNDLKASVFQFQWKNIQALAQLAKRTMDLSVTISDEVAYISAKNGDCEVSWQTLQ
ncbi:MAG: YaeQ family protein [Desulfobacteraceae bacterium]|nr:YaeQ family protein [Desulfobacteraceae bacterium]